MSARRAAFVAMAVIVAAACSSKSSFPTAGSDGAQAVVVRKAAVAPDDGYYYLGQATTQDERDGVLGSGSGQCHVHCGAPPLVVKRSQNIVISHYQCTEWLEASADTPNDWVDTGTATCQYVDSIVIPDGSGLPPGNSNPILGGINPGFKRSDSILKGCDGTGPSAKDATANKAMQRFTVSNPSFEYAGFVLQNGTTGQYVFTNGQVLSLDDNVATLGTPGSHTFPPGYTVVGYYHSHPNTKPTDVDETTGSQFSPQDEAYANQYGLTAYVVDLWDDTSSGSDVQKMAEYKWEPHASPSPAGDISSTQC